MLWPWPWNPGQRSLQVIGTDTDRFTTYDFLLTFHGNHGPISYRVQFQSKIPKFAHPLLFASPLKGFPLEFCTGTGSPKKLEWWCSGPKKKCDDIFSRLNRMHERDRQTDRHRSTAKIALTHSIARWQNSSVCHADGPAEFPRQRGASAIARNYAFSMCTVALTDIGHRGDEQMINVAVKHSQHEWNAGHTKWWRTAACCEFTTSWSLQDWRLA